MSERGESEPGWFHVNGNTYGTWLRGDRRGWRSRHHREHVEGDYKNPPEPRKYERLERYSRELMKRPPVVLSPRQRVVAGQSLVESLRDLGVLLMAASVDGTHYHLLGRFPPDGVRSLVGRAKMHVAFVLRDHGIRGGVWAARCRALPVRSRSHQLNVFHYILDHARRGAWVWGFREGTPWRDV